MVDDMKLMEVQAIFKLSALVGPKIQYSLLWQIYLKDFTSDSDLKKTELLRACNALTI